jgi:hypothetical protein
MRSDGAGDSWREVNVTAIVTMRVLLPTQSGNCRV